MTKKILLGVLITAASLFAGQSLAVTSTQPKAIGILTRDKQLSPKAIGCMADATSKREQAIQDAFNRFSDAQKNAISARSKGLDNAIRNSTNSTIADSMDAVWHTYRMSRKNNVKAYYDEVKGVWSEFKGTIDRCKQIGNLNRPSTDKGSADDEKLEY